MLVAEQDSGGARGGKRQIARRDSGYYWGGQKRLFKINVYKRSWEFSFKCFWAKSTPAAPAQALSLDGPPRPPWMICSPRAPRPRARGAVARRERDTRKVHGHCLPPCRDAGHTGGSAAGTR